MRGSRSCDADPGDAADQQHGHRGDRPDEHLEPAGIGRSRAGSGRALLDERNQKATPRVARIVGITIASMMPSELNRICRSAAAIGPFRIEDAFGAAAEHRGADQEQRRVDRAACQTSSALRSVEPQRCGRGAPGVRLVPIRGQPERHARAAGDHRSLLWSAKSAANSTNR